MAVEAMRRGAADFLEKPFDLDQLHPLLARLARSTLDKLRSGRSCDWMSRRPALKTPNS